MAPGPHGCCWRKPRRVKLSPNDTIGIIGGGQLGRMLALAAAPLGLKCHVLDPDSNAPAMQVCAERTVAAYSDKAALADMASRVAVVTYEFENVDFEAASALPLVRPGPRALEVSQDRWIEKRFLAECGCPTANTMPVATPEAAALAFKSFGGGGAILKTRRLGYDGKGQHRLEPGDDAAAAFTALGGVPCVLESVVPFAFEVSTVIARAVDGSVKAYECPQNTHAGGILRTSQVPSPLPDDTATTLQAQAAQVAEALDYVGVLAIEWFVLPDGSCLANEMAPRVHNSGHWTQEGAFASQFENHMRAVAGWTLAPTHTIAPVRMENLIGDDVERWRSAVDGGSSRLHLYGKAETRPGRKMGHINHVG